MPPAKVLDLGCGDGSATVYFATKGYDTYGIDLNRELIRDAERMAKGYKNERMTFAHGNYLPPDIRARTPPAPHILLQDSPDPYEFLGVQPNQFDIFFIFPWPGQMLSVFDFIRTHAKKGARLMTLGSEEDWQYSGCLRGLFLGTISVLRIFLEEDARRYRVYKK